VSAAVSYESIMVNMVSSAVSGITAAIASMSLPHHEKMARRAGDSDLWVALIADKAMK